MEEKILKELSRRYCKKEQVIEMMMLQCINLGLNNEDSIQMIEQFYKIN